MQVQMNPSQPQPQPCPCGLTREEVRDLRLVGAGGVCTAVWVDGSGKVCGRPLGAHPHQAPQALLQQQTGVKSCWIIRHII